MAANALAMVDSAPGFDIAGLDLPVLGAGGAAASQAETELYLEVWRGDRPTQKIGRFKLRNGLLWSTPAELRELGLVVDAQVPVDSDGLIPLDRLQGLVYDYDVGNQRLVLDIPTALRPRQILGYQPPAAVHADRGSGLLLGYDSYARNYRGQTSLAVATALRMFGRFGTLEQTGLSRAGADSTSYRRLDSRWTYSDPNHLWTWAAGDLISGGLSWTRPVRLGGVQWRRNFSTRPDLITYPVPSFAAQATVPSSVELLVNNIQQFNAGVDDGPFVLSTFPQVSGAGEATLVIRDALGRVTQTSVQIYSDTQRLARGLTDFSVEAGMLRHDFGSDADGYRHTVFSGSLRHGVSDSLTLEAHGESGPDLAVAGVGAVWTPGGQWGLVSTSAAHSQGQGAGWQYSVGYQWLSRGLGIDLQALRSTGEFRDLGSLESGHGPLREQDRVSFWIPVRRGNLAYTWVRWRDNSGQASNVQTLGWSQMFGAHLSLAGNLFHDRVTGTGIGLSVNLSLGERMTTSLGLDHADGRTSTIANLQSAPPYDGGWGWQLQAGDRQGGTGLAEAYLRGRYGDASIGVDHDAGGSGAFFQGSGSLAFMDGQTFASRRISDSFSVVSTGGVPGVPVLFENRVLGVTNSRGYLLVPDLRGWQRNRLAIDPDSLGANYRVPAIEQFITPADADGVMVRFGIQRLQPVVAVLLGPDEAPVPAGTRGVIQGKPGEVLVGFDGEAYIEDAPTGTIIDVDVEGVACRYHLPAADSSSAQARTGPLRCERSDR